MLKWLKRMDCAASSRQSAANDCEYWEEEETAEDWSALPICCATKMRSENAEMSAANAISASSESCAFDEGDCLDEDCAFALRTNARQRRGSGAAKFNASLKWKNNRFSES